MKSKRRERRRAVALVPEVRHWRASGLEVREKSNTDELILTGRPVVFGVPYPVFDAIGEFKETMSPGVAQDVLARGADVRFLVNHEGLPLARSTSGTLTLSETPDGVDFEARLDARQQLSNDLAIAIGRGDVSQMSCGFIVARDEWDDLEENRVISKFSELLDVSAVTYPASPTTSIKVAQRMALEIPVESRARLRRLYAQARAGTPLSARDQQAVTAMLGGFRDPIRPSGRVRTRPNLRGELERLGRSGRATKAADLRRTLAEHERKPVVL